MKVKSKKLVTSFSLGVVVVFALIFAMKWAGGLSSENGTQQGQTSVGSYSLSSPVQAGNAAPAPVERRSYDLRNVAIGMSLDEVKAAEEGYPLSVENYQTLRYNELDTNLFGKIRNVDLEYRFADNKLYKACYFLNRSEQHVSDPYVERYEEIKKHLRENYGPPYYEREVNNDAKLSVVDFEGRRITPSSGLRAVYNYRAIWSRMHHDRFVEATLFSVPSLDRPFELAVCFSNAAGVSDFLKK